MCDLDRNLGWWKFQALVTGLSPECRFWHAVRDKPEKVSTPVAIANITGRYLGPDDGGAEGEQC